MSQFEKLKEGNSKIKYVSIIRRIITLLRVQGDRCSHEIAEDVHQFTNDQFPGYDPNNIIFLKHHHCKVQRYQLSGLCYIHAPAVLHFHLSSIQSGKRESMLNIVGYVREKFTTNQLKKHILENEGGSSSDLLKILTKTTSIISSIDQIKENFDTYGPALVSVFKIYEDFCISDQFHYHDLPSGEFNGNHAMVLVGYREEQGKDYFLLQNWWKKKQFVEVSSSYLIASGAVIYFVTGTVSLLENNFPANDGSYEYYEAEAIVDMAEKFMPEW